MIADFLDPRVLGVYTYQVQSLEELPFGSIAYTHGVVCELLSFRDDTLAHLRRRVKQDGQAQRATVPQSLLQHKPLDEGNVGEEGSLEIPWMVFFRVGRKAFRILQSCMISIRTFKGDLRIDKNMFIPLEATGRNAEYFV
jgi:hypothetical protein